MPKSLKRISSAFSDKQDDHNLPDAEPADSAQRLWQKRKDEELFKAVEAGDLQIESVKAAIAAGADLESRHVSDRTALHMAARTLQPKCVRLLLESGCSPSPQANTSTGQKHGGFTPLHNAIYYHGCTGVGTYANGRGKFVDSSYDARPVIMLLIEGKADLEQRIHCKECRRQGVDDRGQPTIGVTKFDHSGENCPSGRAALQHPAGYGQTPLQVAEEEGKQDLIDILQLHGRLG